jgi:hypothetical protein
MFIRFIADPLLLSYRLATMSRSHLASFLRLLYTLNLTIFTLNLQSNTTDFNIEYTVI